MSTDLPFDRRLRRQRRDRSAASVGDGDYLSKLMGDELLDRLDLVTRDFRQALDLGCGAGYLSGRLRARGIDVVAADSGFSFARMAGGVQCDEDRLPFADATFDLIVSAGALDGVNDLPGALALIRRVLKPDGLFLASFAGAGSLPALRSAMLAADAADGKGTSPRLHPQIDVRTAGDLLARAGFALPVADSHRLAIRFESLSQLIGDLRAIGGTNILSLRSGRALGRLGFAAATADFAAQVEEDGRTTEYIEIVSLIGWGPAPNQPQPARRGSGSASLAEALRPK
ncbi:methyltransferase domain-containing protein [Sphingosinicella rhizophila]|uniref:Methyltransferase domain-containing protein n=1 Tax=Sphingosinicella rhizophila TaxID=3050082 RepID=A0ABU3Q4J0_9SPHN|nr:methyltransferase domain-containing protein [Sphingosinicella sp. GR2756]MDT9597850.1 methyltransferase domain-containing protein [Sphingosinicella sp. GR2756]